MRRLAERLPLAILFVSMLFIPIFLHQNQYYICIITIIVMYAALATAWHIICGFGGQLDLASSAYFGIGAYITGTLLLRWNISPWIGMILGGLAACVLALAVSYPAFRLGLRAVWYALATSSLVEVLKTSFLMWEEVGGPIERYLPTYEWSVYHMRFSMYEPYYYIFLALLLIVLYTNYRVQNLKLGYYLLAIRENEEAAEMLGVDARRYKLIGVITYAFLSALIGSVYVNFAGFLHPETMFSGWRTLEVAVLGIVGGLGTVLGPALAAFVIVGASEYLRATFGAFIPGLHLLFYGSILICIVLLRPEGIMGMLEKSYRTLISWVSTKTVKGGG